MHVKALERACSVASSAASACVYVDGVQDHADPEDQVADLFVGVRAVPRRAHVVHAGELAHMHEHTLMCTHARTYETRERIRGGGALMSLDYRPRLLVVSRSPPSLAGSCNGRGCRVSRLRGAWIADWHWRITQRRCLRCGRILRGGLGVAISPEPTAACARVQFRGLTGR